MKPSQALFACSLLGVACAISCGSEDEKAKVVASDGGAGGEGAVTEPGDGGKAGEPPVVIVGGAGGEAPVVTPGGAGAGGEAVGGAGGEPAACVGFDLPGAGGQAGAAPTEAEPLFWCRGVAGQYRPSTGKITLITPPGLAAAVTGKFVANYDYYATPEDEEVTSACTEGSVVGKGSTLELTVPFVGAPYNYIEVPAIAVQDECGEEVRMNRTPVVTGCLSLRFRPSNEGSEVWNVECYEGLPQTCPTEPVCPEIPPNTL